MRSVPKLKELSAKHADQGLVLIGIHSKRGGEKMPAFVRENGIQYPVAWDKDGAMAKAFGVDGYPDYQVIDRSGKVRVADLANGAVESTILKLLAEPAPSAQPKPVPKALQAASEVALRKDTRILGVAGSEKQRAALLGMRSKDRALDQLMRNEYQVAELTVANGAQPSVIAFTAQGEALGALPLAGMDAPALAAFLKEHQLPVKDARNLWAGALAEAKRTKKRVLVHLGAPW